MELGRKTLLIFTLLCLITLRPSFLYGKAHAGSVAVVSATVTVIRPEEDLISKDATQNKYQSGYKIFEELGVSFRRYTNQFQNVLIFLSHKEKQPKNPL